MDERLPLGLAGISFFHGQAANGIRLVDGLAKALFWGGLLAGGFCGFGDLGGSKSHLRRLRLGFADGNGFSSQAVFGGNGF